MENGLQEKRSWEATRTNTWILIFVLTVDTFGLLHIKIKLYHSIRYNILTRQIIQPFTGWITYLILHHTLLMFVQQVDFQLKCMKTNKCTYQLQVVITRYVGYKLLLFLFIHFQLAIAHWTKEIIFIAL